MAHPSGRRVHADHVLPADEPLVGVGPVDDHVVVQELRGGRPVPGLERVPEPPDDLAVARRGRPVLGHVEGCGDVSADSDQR